MAAGITEAEAREEAEPRFRLRPEVSITLLPPDNDANEGSDTSGLPNAMDCPIVAGIFPADIAFLSSSRLEGLTTLFPSSAA